MFLSKRIYYGWVVVATLLLVEFAVQATGTLNLGLFVIPMGAELAISRGQFGWLTASRSLAGGFSAVLLGRVVDRFGPRLVLPAASLVTSVCLMGLAASTEMYQSMPLFALIGLVGLSAPGGGLLVSVPVAKWFVRKRGMALAFSSLGLGIGAVTFLPVTQLLIDGVGWRKAWLVLATISMTLIIPLSLIFLRRQPEDIGLNPDGEAGPAPGGKPGVGRREAVWSVSQAVGTKAFWLLASAMMLHSFAMGGTSVHRIPYWVELGFSPQLVSLSFSADAAGAAVMALAAGFLLDRFPPRFLAAASFAGFAGAVGLMLVATSTAHMFASTVLFGLCAGANVVAQTYIWADYYGRATLGAIRGVTMPALLLASAVGAPTVGYIYDAMGSYVPAWWLLIGAYGAAFLVMMFALPPRGYRTYIEGGQIPP